MLDSNWFVNIRCNKLSNAVSSPTNLSCLKTATPKFSLFRSYSIKGFWPATMLNSCSGSIEASEEFKFSLFPFPKIATGSL